MKTPKHCMACWTVWVGVLAVVGPAHAETIYVSKGGDDAKDGLTWATAKYTVQAGLNAASSGDQVWVAAGTYVENIALKLGVALYGGLAGTENPTTFDLADRNFLVHPTILDGNQADSVVTSPSTATATTRIDGFTVRNGAGRLSGSYRYGGGIYCSYSSPTIANNTITGNTLSDPSYGGGIYCDHSSPKIINNTIGNNAASSRGGGIYCSYSSPMIANNAIKGNRASGGSGGGISCYYSSPTIVANTIAGNSAFTYGGGVSCISSSSPVVADNAITGNRAGSTGGGIYCSGSSPTIANNTIAGNSASEDGGGGTYCINCTLPPTIVNTIIAFNSSGVYNSGGSLTLRYNCVYGNITGNYLVVADQTGINGNISADPLFIRNPCDGGDGWGDDPNTTEMNEGANDDYGDLRLRVDSPCIDAADNAAVPADAADLDGDLNTTEPLPIDLGGGKRFFDDPATTDTGAGTPPIVDIGAWEYFLVLIPDFDRDQDVDQADFAHMQECLVGRRVVEPACENANLNDDRYVDQDDVAIFEACASGPGIPADPACLE